MRLLFKLSFMFVLFSSMLFAQEDTCSYSVNGKVLDIETKEPIPYVSVKVQGLEKSTQTNIQGEFFINGLCSDKNTLIISCFGYCDSICEHHYELDKIPYIYLTQKVVNLETVTIQAEQNREEGTQSISQTTLKKLEIKSDPTQSLASSIANQQGVTLTSNGTNVQLPVIHGLYGNRILILNNGIKHGFQNWGADHAPEIDISSANNITIIKGSSGIRFGPEALGGTIIVEPNPLYLKEPINAELSADLQSNGRGYNSSFEIGQGFKKLSYFLNGSYTKIGDRHTPDYVLTNSGKEEKSAGMGARYQLDNWYFKIHYSYINQNLALLRSSIANSGNAFIKAINSDTPLFVKPFSYTIGEPNQLTQHHFGRAEVNWMYASDGELTFRVGRQLNKRQEFDVRRNADRPIIDLDLVTTNYELEWKHPDWLKINGILGFQYFYQDNDNNPGTSTTAFIPNYNTDRFSAFLIESKRLGKNTIEVGIRLDHELNNARGREHNQNVFRDEYQFTNLTSSIGYVREISENSSIRTNLGGAWRTPNMAELFSFGQHGFKTSFGLLRYYTNKEGELRTDRVIKMTESDVQPEKGYKLINEFQTTKNRNSFTTTIFSHYIENYIFDRPLAVIGTVRGPMPVFVFDQTDVFFMGFDNSWKRDWTKQISGTLGLSYLWSTNLGRKESLINQPPISVSYKLDWNQGELWKLGSLRLIIKPNYVFKQLQAPRTIRPEDLIDGSVKVTANSEIFDFKDAPNGYFLLDVSWRFVRKNISASISVKNLLNTRYRDYLNEMRYFADEPGRNILFNVSYKFKAKDNE